MKETCSAEDATFCHIGLKVTNFAIVTLLGQYESPVIFPFHRCEELQDFCSDHSIIIIATKSLPMDAVNGLLMPVRHG